MKRKNKRGQQLREYDREFCWNVLNRQPEPVSCFDSQGRIHFANRAYERLFGVHQSELLGRTIYSLIPRGERQRLRTHLRALTRRRPEGVHENRVLAAGGKERIYQWVNRAIYGKDGKLIGYQSAGRDVTDLRRAEDSLRRSRDLLTQIIDAVPEPIFVKDSKRRMILVNKAECRLTGHPRREVLGRTDDGFFPKDQVAEFRRRDLMVLKTGRDNVNAEDITDARGRLHHIITKKSLLRGPGGERMIVGIIRDVTDLKRAEEALRAREEQFRTLLENLAVGVFRTSTAGVLVQANEAHARILGYRSAKDIIGRDVRSFYVNPRDRDTLLRLVKRDGLVRNHLVNLKKKNGESILVSLTARGHFSQGGRLQWLDGVIEDVTERQRIEDELRLTQFSFERAADAILWTDPAGRLVRVNQAACRLSGYPREQLLRMRVPDLDERSTPEMDAVFWSRLRKYSFATWETMVRHRDGRRIPVEVHANYIRFGGRELACSFVRDISERQRIEAERRRFATALMEVQEAERREISHALHDHLGQLLTLARLEIGGLTPRDAQGRAALSKVRQRLDEALSAVRNMAVTLRPPILDDMGLRAALETMAEEFTRTSGVETKISWHGRLCKIPREVETGLYRVFQEALTNVARHARATRVFIRVRCEPDKMIFHIKDNGIGGSGLRRKTGGLGLVNMRERLAGFGGGLDMRLESGRGVALMGWLPLRGRNP